MENTNPQGLTHKKLMISVLIIMVALGGIVVLTLYIKHRPINQIKKSVPDYFIDTSAQLTVYTPEDLQDYKLLKGQSLSQNGLQYEVTTPYKQAIRDILTTMDQKGWTAIGGSAQTPTTTMVKMNNGTDTLFIRIESNIVDTPNKSTITILPVLKTK